MTTEKPDVNAHIPWEVVKIEDECSEKDCKGRIIAIRDPDPGGGALCQQKCQSQHQSDINLDEYHRLKVKYHESLKPKSEENL